MTYTFKANEKAVDGMKACTMCKESKPATTEYFRKQHSFTNKLQPKCKKCMRKYEKAYVRKGK